MPSFLLGKSTSSFAQLFERADRRPSGFDYQRIVLAILILCFHSVATSYGGAADSVFWDTPARPFARMLLPMFFALSGFLVAGSLQRSKTLITFLGFRIVRIYPALAVEAITSALILGPLLTSKQLHSYFSDPSLYRYLLNIIGDIHYYLPGVLQENPLPLTINGQLWTIPYELGCYIAISILFALGVNRKPLIAPVSALAICVAFAIGKTIQNGGQTPDLTTPMHGPLLIACFLFGVSFYLYREVVPWSRPLIFSSIVITICLLGPVKYGAYLAPFFAAYATIALGLTNIKRVKLVKTADYSYGIFLYSFPIQQGLMSACPWARIWYLNIAISLPVSLLVAFISWHLVEKRALGWKHYFESAERGFLNVKSALRYAVYGAVP